MLLPTDVLRSDRCTHRRRRSEEGKRSGYGRQATRLPVYDLMVQDSPDGADRRFGHERIRPLVGRSAFAKQFGGSTDQLRPSLDSRRTWSKRVDEGKPGEDRVLRDVGTERSDRTVHTSGPCPARTVCGHQLGESLAGT